MKVKVLYFEGSSDDPGPYVHICVDVYLSDGRYYRRNSEKFSLSVMEHDDHDDHEDYDYKIVDPEMFNFLMDKFGTLEGTYAEWEL